MSPKVQKYIWYQIEGCEVSNIEQPTTGQYIRLCRVIIKKEAIPQVAASTLILRVKKVNEIEYTTLNTNIFRDECSNDFNRLINKFNITQRNPINVTYPGMYEIATLKLAQETSSLAGASTTAGSSAQVPSDEIHVRYNDQTFTFRRSILEEYSISNVEDLIDILKLNLRKYVEIVTEKVITLRRGENEVLNPETPISGLYNTVNEALHVVVVDDASINLIVKAPENREFHFYNQRTGSLDEIIEFIKSREALTQFITDNTIFR